MNHTPSAMHIMRVIFLCVMLSVAIFAFATSTDATMQITISAVLFGCFVLLGGYALMRLRIDLF